MKGSYKNILSMWDAARTYEKNENWYATANSNAVSISLETGTPYLSVIGVIAALSPRNEWSRNLDDAYRMCQVAACGGEAEDLRQVRVCTFNNNKEKAIQILLLEPAATEGEILGILNGPKVQEFFACIKGPGDEVCIDGHAYAVWRGERIPLERVPSIGKKLRERIKEDYRKVAREVGVKPYWVQSTTWLAYKRIHKI